MVLGVGGPIGMATLEQQRPKNEQRKFRLASTESQRAMHNIVRYRNDGDEDQEHDQWRKVPAAEVSGRGERSDSHKWSSQCQNLLRARRLKQIATKLGKCWQLDFS